MRSTEDILRELARRPKNDAVEVTLTVRARIARVSDSHGTSVKLELEKRDYDINDPREVRTVWVDPDEIVEVQP